MRLLVLLIILSYPIILLGQSCLSKRQINLSDPGGSLYPMVASDQNGLGICHIEQLHKMLKAKLPGHPDFSRLQLTITDKKELDKDHLFKQTIRWREKNGSIGGTYLDAGTSCESFNRIKGQSICLAKDDRFEQLTKMHPEYQEKIVNALANYYESKPKTTSPLFYLKTNPFFFPTSEITTAFQKCPVPEKKLNSLKSAYKRYLKQISSEFGFLSAVEKQYLDMMDWSRLAMTGYALIQGKSYFDYVVSQIPYVSKRKLLESDLLMAEAKIFSQEMQKQESCVADHLKHLPNYQKCTNAFDKNFNDVLDLTSYGLKLSEIVKILYGSDDRDEFFSNAFSCNGNKYQVPESVTCKTQELSSLAKVSKSEEDFVKANSQKILNYLDQGTPIGISVCTRFFNGPTAKTMKIGTGKFDCGDEKSPQYKKGEAGHAVTIIGSRCQNGIQEFLVQNSWGNGCFYSDKYECTHKGGFWAPANSIIPNVIRLQTLE